MARSSTRKKAAPESPRTTKLYDRTKERLTQDEVERIRFSPCHVSMFTDFRVSTI
jgi:hypothetical protein